MTKPIIKNASELLRGGKHLARIELELELHDLTELVQHCEIEGNIQALLDLAKEKQVARMSGQPEPMQLAPEQK